MVQLSNESNSSVYLSKATIVKNTYHRALGAAAADTDLEIDYKMC